MKGKAFEMMRALRHWELDEVQRWFKSTLPRDNKCLPLLRLFCKDHPDYYDEAKWKQRAFKKLFSRTEPYQDKKMRVLLSNFCRHMEEFYTEFHLRNDPYARKMVYLREMRRRHSDRLMVETAKAIHKQQEEAAERGLHYYRRKIELEEIMGMEHRQNVAKLPAHLHRMTESIERYHLLHRVTHQRALLDLAQFSKKHAEVKPLGDFYSERVASQADADGLLEYALADVENRAGNLTVRELEEKFTLLKKILPLLSQTERLEYVFALNNQSNRAKRITEKYDEYKEVAWKIRQLLTIDRLWEEAGAAKPQVFRNNIDIALSSDKLEWAEKFLHKNINRLSGSDRVETEFYCRAQIAFWKKDYEAALAATPTINIKLYEKDKTLIRLVLTRIYFALITEGKDYYDLLDNHLNAFEKMIWRNYRERTAYRRRYLTMIQTTRKMVKYISRNGGIKGIEEELIYLIESQPPFPTKHWFMQILR